MPPVVSTRSARTSWSSMVSRSLALSSGTAATRKVCAPASVIAVDRACPLASKTVPGRAVRPGSTSSSPMDRTTTRGRGWTSTRERPTPASSATCRAPTRAPERRTTCPSATSSARRRMFSPTAGAERTPTSATPWSVNSRATTASAPAGTGAPDAMRIAVPGTRAAGSTTPARISSVTGRVTGASSAAREQSEARTAYPSQAARSATGRLKGARTSSASTQDTASASWTSRGGCWSTAAMQSW